MKGKNFERLYARLTPEERFRLVLEALARQDEAEADRLTYTCPRKTYTFTSNDLAYGNRVRAAWQITVCVCLELICLLNTLKTIETTRESFCLTLGCVAKESALSYHLGWQAGCEHAWRAAGREGFFPWSDRTSLAARSEEMAEQVRNETQKGMTGDVLADLESASRDITIRVRTLWEAFSQFCQDEMDLEAEKLVRAWLGPMLGELEKVKDLSDPPEVNSEELREYQAVFTRGWSDLIRL